MGQTIQVLDLGEASIKLVRGYRIKDGSLVVDRIDLEPVHPAIEDLGSDLGADALKGLEAPLARIAARSLSRRSGVWITGGETLVRSGLKHFPAVPQARAPEVIRMAYTRFLDSHIDLGQRLGHPVILSRSPADEMVDLVLAQSFVRHDLLERLREMLARLRLGLAGIVSPVVAVNGLVEALLAGSPEAGEKPRALVDVGFGGAGVYLLEGTRVVGHRRLYTGGATFLTDGSRIGEPRAVPSPLEQHLQTLGLAPSPGAIDDLDLDDSSREALRSHLTGAWNQHLRALALGLALTRGDLDPVQDPGASMDPATVTAPAPAPVPVTRGPIGFVGGLAASRGYIDAVRDGLETPCLLLDPALVVSPARRTAFPAPATVFATAVGALHALTSDRQEEYNLAHDHLARLQEVARSRRRWYHLDPRYPVLALVLSAITVFLVWVQTSSLEDEVTSLEKSARIEADGLPDQERLQHLLMDYRRVRSTQVLARAQIEAIGRLAANRPDWPRIFNEIHRLAPRNGFAITGLAFKVHWPGSRSRYDAPLSTEKSLEVTIYGEAREVATVTAFAKTLEATSRFDGMAIADSRLVSGNKGIGNKGIGETSSVRYYRFQVKGEVTLEPLESD